MIEKLYEEVQKMSRIVSRNSELKDDLAQEVILDVLKIDKEKLNQLNEQGVLLNYVFRITYLKWNTNNGHELAEGKSFKSQYRDYANITTDIENQNIIEDNELTPFLDPAFDKLSTIDRMTIEEYIRVNFNISLMAYRTKINRENLKIRIDDILDKIRNNHTISDFYTTLD